VPELAFWIVQVPGWLLFLYLVVAQCTSALSYTLGVKMGTQEPAERITEVGVAFFKGFAGADLVFYVPLLGFGLIGHYLGAVWTDLILGAALGVSIYWPVTCLWAVRAAKGAPGWALPKEAQYWIVLPVITLWAAVAMTVMLAN
jgi:hypothetical protein